MLPPILRSGVDATAFIAALLACSGDSTALAPTDTAGAAGTLTITHNEQPAYAGDFADPFVLVADGVYYAYATNVPGANVPMLRSSDLVEWAPAGDAMPLLPDWAVSGRSLTWAPAVAATSKGYALYYTARDRRSGLQCIGLAESTSPSGPFADTRTEAFICQTDLGGSIDASVVRHPDGGMYLIWKNDGNCCNKRVALWSQRLSADGRRLEGQPAALLDRDLPWEGPLIEGPTMWLENGTWHLLYSANRWNTDHYATGAAVCDSPLGPCRKTGVGPVMASDSSVAGPGGAEVFTDLGGRRWLAYHGWSASAVGYRKGGARSLRLGRVEVLGEAAVASEGLAAPDSSRHEKTT